MKWVNILKLLVVKFKKVKIDYFHQIIVVFSNPIMNINDKSVLEMLNTVIASDRLNKNQILQMVNLVSLSNDINDLKDNIKWESLNSFH